jgi:hypothetical protein
MLHQEQLSLTLTSHLPCKPGEERLAKLVGGVANHQDFPTLWKDSDPDIPIRQQANAEWSHRRCSQTVQ